MPASRAGARCASRSSARSAFGLVVDVMELADRGVACGQHLDVQMARDRLCLLGGQARHEPVHELAPGPEVVVRRAAHLGQPGHRALERVRMHIGHSRQRRSGERLRAVPGCALLDGREVALRVDRDRNVVYPAAGQERRRREVARHAVSVNLSTIARRCGRTRAARSSRKRNGAVSSM
jgi:hypothetical protein